MSASDAHLVDGGSHGSMEVTDHSTAGVTRPLEDADMVGRNVVQRRTILPPSGPLVALPIGASPSPTAPVFWCTIYSAQESNSYWCLTTSFSHSFG